VSVKNKTILNRLVNNLLKLKGVDKVLREWFKAYICNNGKK
jgi:hypothetical protein